MKIAGDVRRGNDNAKRLRFRPVGATDPEGACLLPKRGGAAFCGSEVERFVHHGFLVCDPVGDALGSNGGVPSGAGYGRRRRKRHKRYKGIVAVEVNARRKSGGYFRPRAIL
jgi:hypothetical protein